MVEIKVVGCRRRKLDSEKIKIMLQNKQPFLAVLRNKCGQQKNSTAVKPSNWISRIRTDCEFVRWSREPMVRICVLSKCYINNSNVFCDYRNQNIVPHNDMFVETWRCHSPTS